MGRTAEIDRIPDGLGPEAFATEWVYGKTRKELAEQFGVSLRTVDDYKKRDDIKAIARKLVQDRSLTVKRVADRKILDGLDRLDPADDMETILKVRKAFTADGPTDDEKSDAELLEEAFRILDENPEAVADMQRAADG